MTFALDTNVLIYALDPTDGDKHRIASHIIERGTLMNMAMAAQVLGEYINVARRKMPDRLSVALDVAETFAAILPVMATAAHHIAPAGRISRDYSLQFWDALIITVYRAAQVGLLLTEDLQDGQVIDGVEILNPFKAGNRDRLADILSG